MQFSDSEINSIQNILDKALSGCGRVVAEDVWAAMGTDISKSKFKIALSKAFKEDKLPGFISTRGRYGGIKKSKEGKKIKSESLKTQDVTSFIETPLNKAHKDEVKKVLDAGKEAADRARAALLLKKSDKEKIGPNMERVIPYPDMKNSYRSKWEEINVNGRTLIHSLNIYQFRDLMKHVFQIEESKEGNVSAFGKTFQCSEEQLRMLDAILFYCFGAQERIE